MSEFDCKRFNPSIHEKYSPNLYKNLKSLTSISVYKSPKVFRDNDGCLWLGVIYDGDFIGCRFNRCLAKPNVISELGCYSSLTHELKEVQDFWEEYQSKGRCAIDVDHTMIFINDLTRYTKMGDVRACNWCGLEQKKRKRLFVKVVSDWVNMEGGVA